MAAGNGVRRIWVGQNGLLSTPAVSAVIRERVGVDVSSRLVSVSCTHSFNNNNGIVLCITSPLLLSMNIRDPGQQEHLY